MVWGEEDDGYVFQDQGCGRNSRNCYSGVTFDWLHHIYVEKIMETLYCYKLDELSGEITKFEILEYHFKKNAWSDTKDEYCFRADLYERANYPYCVKRNQLDRLVHDKVFTFNPDIDYGVQVIKDTVLDREKTATKELNKYKNLLAKINMNTKRP